MPSKKTEREAPLFHDPGNRKTAFADTGFEASIQESIEELKALYRLDSIPWVIGYSGGKDSTAVAQLVWMALAELDQKELKKPVYIITTDTLVENPVVANWVEQSLDRMQQAADDAGLPIRTQLILPRTEDSFWVGLIGKGYPAPRHKFRWCTERLKIKPSNTFIEERVSAHGEVVLFLGARSGESQRRASVLKQRESLGQADFGLTPHPDLPGCLVHTPIKPWSSDDVWQFLLQMPNPWGNNNESLMAMYRGATADNECPVVVDTSTPSCGNSRFGCWVCTLVDEDKSMAAMIQNDFEKEWMLPMLQFRSELDFRSDQNKARDRSRRDFRRITGQLSYYGASKEEREVNENWVDEIQLTPGPYTQPARAELLRKLLEAQHAVNNHPQLPEHLHGIKLIRDEELEEIRRIWVRDKHEIEDLLPEIYTEVLGEPYPGTSNYALALNTTSLDKLKDKCESDMQYELARSVLSVVGQYRFKGRRMGITEELREAVTKCIFETAEEALDFKKRQVMAAEGPVQLTRSGKAVEAKPVSKERDDA